jgi:hypothetical protein
VSYSYRPKDPHGKLREVAGKWVAAMRVAGRAPNTAVTFVPAVAPDEARVLGFLIEDRRADAAGERYLVLEDGDVMRAPEDRWLLEPDDELVTLLSKTLADARMGGSGGLADGDATVARVPDRRSTASRYEGPERRGSN